MRRQTRVENQNHRHTKRWTVEEESCLVRHVEARPQNLTYCFHIVAESIGRTPQAVQAHWYTVTSKKSENLCFFTASRHHVSKNRKNGMGEESNPTIWRRLVAAIRQFL